MYLKYAIDAEYLLKTCPERKVDQGYSMFLEFLLFPRNRSKALRAMVTFPEIFLHILPILNIVKFLNLDMNVHIVIVRVTQKNIVFNENLMKIKPKNILVFRNQNSIIAVVIITQIARNEVSLCVILMKYHV